MSHTGTTRVHIPHHTSSQTAEARPTYIQHASGCPRAVRAVLAVCDACRIHKIDAPISAHSAHASLAKGTQSNMCHRLFQLITTRAPARRKPVKRCDARHVARALMSVRCVSLVVATSCRRRVSHLKHQTLCACLCRLPGVRDVTGMIFSAARLLCSSQATFPVL